MGIYNDKQSRYGFSPSGVYGQVEQRAPTLSLKNILLFKNFTITIHQTQEKQQILSTNNKQKTHMKTTVNISEILDLSSRRV